MVRSATPSFGRPGAHEHRVVPGQLGERPRQLLQPPVVREPPVSHVRIGTEHDLQPGQRGRGRGRRPGAQAGRNGRLRLLGVGHHAVVDGAQPPRLEVGLAAPASSARAELVPALLRLRGEDREHLVRRPAAVERRYQRLLDGDHAASGAGVAPAPRGDAPGPRAIGSARTSRPRRGRVEPQRHPVQLLREAQVRRRVVDGIRAQDQQRVDLAGHHLARQRGQRVQLRVGAQGHRRAEGHGVRRCRGAR